MCYILENDISVFFLKKKNGTQRKLTDVLSIDSKDCPGMWKAIRGVNLSLRSFIKLLSRVLLGEPWGVAAVCVMMGGEQRTSLPSPAPWPWEYLEEWRRPEHNENKGYGKYLIFMQGFLISKDKVNCTILFLTKLKLNIE